MNAGSPTAAPPLRPGDLVLRRFRVEAKAGSGALAEVFRARDEASGELVAVKVLRRAVADGGAVAARFLREARIARRLTHPAVPSCVAVGMLPGALPVLVTRFIAGESLRAPIDRGELPSVPDALRLGARVAEALDAAHAVSVIHRDIKPSNVLLEAGHSLPEGVRVVDFGLAFVLDEPRLSATHTALGTAEYLPPEQCRGERVTPAADLYALGATLAHALTGRTLFPGAAAQQRAAHVHEAPPDLTLRRPDLPRSVADYLTSLLRKRPEERPLSAALVARDLLALAEARDPDAPRSDPDLRNALHASRARAAASRQRLVAQLVALAAERLARGEPTPTPQEEALERALDRIDAGSAAEQQEIVARAR